MQVTLWLGTVIGLSSWIFKWNELVLLLAHWSHFWSIVPICRITYVPLLFSPLNLSLICLVALRYLSLKNIDKGNAFLKIHEPSFVCFQYSCFCGNSEVSEEFRNEIRTLMKSVYSAFAWLGLASEVHSGHMKAWRPVVWEQVCLWHILLFLSPQIHCFGTNIIVTINYTWSWSEFCD